MDRYHLYSKLEDVRKSQIIINNNILNKKYAIPIHLAIGHEAISVAVQSQFGIDDNLLLTHRNIHYHLAFGTSIDDLELFYLLTDNKTTYEKMGSMNLTQPNIGNIYTSNILGNNLLVGLGIALSDKISKNKSVTWIVTGDGAIEEGAFYESILNAASLELNIIYIVENNSWSLATSISERRKNIDLQSFSQTFNVGYTLLEGNDVLTYSERLKKIHELCLNEKKPQIVEVSLSSLGYYEVEENSRFRTVNYHSGYSRIVNTDSGLILESEEDPLYVNLRNKNYNEQ